MVNISHNPGKHCNNIYTITGDSIDEIVSCCVGRISNQSKEYYKKVLKEDLEVKGEGIIDIHAGMGNFYNVILNKKGTI